MSAHDYILVCLASMKGMCRTDVATVQQQLPEISLKRNKDTVSNRLTDCTHCSILVFYSGSELVHPVVTNQNFIPSLTPEFINV